MTVPTGTGQLRYKAVLKPLQWEQRMRMAMALLDRAGCSFAAAHLQQAIGTVEADQDETAMPPQEVTWLAG